MLAAFATQPQPDVKSPQPVSNDKSNPHPTPRKSTPRTKQGHLEAQYQIPRAYPDKVVDQPRAKLVIKEDTTPTPKTPKQPKVFRSSPGVAWWLHARFIAWRIASLTQAQNTQAYHRIIGWRIQDLCQRVQLQQICTQSLRMTVRARKFGWQTSTTAEEARNFKHFGTKDHRRAQTLRNKKEENWREEAYKRSRIGNRWYKQIDILSAFALDPSPILGQPIVLEIHRANKKRKVKRKDTPSKSEETGSSTEEVRNPRIPPQTSHQTRTVHSYPPPSPNKNTRSGLIDKTITQQPSAHMDSRRPTSTNQTLTQTTQEYFTSPPPPHPIPLHPPHGKQKTLEDPSSHTTDFKGNEADSATQPENRFTLHARTRLTLEESEWYVTSTSRYQDSTPHKRTRMDPNTRTDK